MKIVIDAGHGLNTPGKRAPDDSMREYHFNSITARYVIEQLREYECELLTTFEDARDVPLMERTRKANAWGADVFVSIHANAAGSKWCGACGIETYVYTSATSKSVTLANAVQRRLVDAAGLRDRRVKRGDFHVLRETKMPAILIECGFMDNQSELVLLKSDSYRRKCAGAIAKSIVEVYQLKSKKQNIANVVIDGERIQGKIIDGVTYVPVKLMCNALDLEMKWYEKEKKIEIDSK